MSPIGNLKTSNRSGFTLIEILLVVLILAIVVSVALPKFQGTLSQLQARTAAQNIYELALFAKERAILETTFFKLKYDPTENKVRLLKKNDKGKYTRYESRLGKPIQIKPPFTLRWTNSAKEILFTPNGESDKVEIHLNQNSQRLYTVIIGKPLGRITLKDAP